VLLIVEPFRVKQQRVSLAPLWQAYAQAQPGAAQLRLGVIDLQWASPAPHVVVLTDLPARGEAFLQQLPPVTEVPAPPQHGTDLRQVARDFVRGHGKDYFYEHLSYLHTRLYQLDDALAQGQNWAELRPGIDHAWLGERMGLFRERWQRYAPKLELLPPTWHPSQYAPLLQAMDRYLANPSALDPALLLSLLSGMYQLRRCMDDIRRVLLPAP